MGVLDLNAWHFLVERCFKSLICWLDLCLSSLLVAFISLCFSSLKNSFFIKLNSFSTNSWQKLFMSRLTESKCPDLIFGPSWCVCVRFLFSQPYTYISLILKAVTYALSDLVPYFLWKKLLRQVLKILWWIKSAITAVEKRRSRGSIDSIAIERCREAVELEENRFFKERKNT